MCFDHANDQFSEGGIEGEGDRDRDSCKHVPVYYIVRLCLKTVKTGDGLSTKDSHGGRETVVGIGCRKLLVH